MQRNAGAGVAAVVAVGAVAPPATPQLLHQHRGTTDQDQDSATLRRRLLTFKPAAGRAKIRTFNRNITSEKYLLLHHFTTAIKPLSGVEAHAQNRHKYEIISGYLLKIRSSICQLKNEP